MIRIKNNTTTNRKQTHQRLHNEVLNLWRYDYIYDLRLCGPFFFKHLHTFIHKITQRSRAVLYVFYCVLFHHHHEPPQFVLCPRISIREFLRFNIVNPKPLSYCCVQTVTIYVTLNAARYLLLWIHYHISYIFFFYCFFFNQHFTPGRLCSNARRVYTFQHIQRTNNVTNWSSFSNMLCLHYI